MRAAIRVQNGRDERTKKGLRETSDQPDAMHY